MCTLILYLGFMGTFKKKLNTHLYCLVGCLSMIVWTHAALGVLHACFFVFLYLPLFSAVEHVSRGKALWKYAHYYYYYYYFRWTPHLYTIQLVCYLVFNVLQSGTDILRR